jgi:hypothetical protein
MSGYHLQTVVARQLSGSGVVTEEWSYRDRISGEPRPLDVFAHRRLKAGSVKCDISLNLLIECKKSDLPYIFFEAATAHGSNRALVRISDQTEHPIRSKPYTRFGPNRTAFRWKPDTNS